MGGVFIWCQPGLHVCVANQLASLGKVLDKALHDLLQFYHILSFVNCYSDRSLADLDVGIVNKAAVTCGENRIGHALQKFQHRQFPLSFWILYQAASWAKNDRSIFCFCKLRTGIMHDKSSTMPRKIQRWPWQQQSETSS